jgi:hypothetical protein
MNLLGKPRQFDRKPDPALPNEEQQPKRVETFIYEDFVQILKFFALIGILYSDAISLIQVQYFVLLLVLYFSANLVATNPFYEQNRGHVLIKMMVYVLCIFLLFLYLRFIPEANKKVGETGYNYLRTRNITEMTQLTTDGSEPLVSINNVIT